MILSNQHEQVSGRSPQQSQDKRMQITVIVPKVGTDLVGSKGKQKTFH